MTETTAQPKRAPRGTGGADSWEPAIGETAEMRHCRQGTATVKVLAYLDDTWADVEIVSGVLRSKGCGAVWQAGDVKRVVRRDCYWVPNVGTDALQNGAQE